MGPDIDGDKMNGNHKDRILVTGGAGFIGSCLVAKLLREGHEVVALDNFSTSPLNTLRNVISNSNFTLVQANTADPIPGDIEPCSRIYHLACPASPKYFSTDPLTILDTCYFGTRNVLEKARQWNARLLLASTSEVYGQPERNIQAETYFGNVNCFGPRSCYDEGKRVAEALAFAYRVQHPDSPEIRIARIFNAYGPGMHASDGRVVTNFIGAALRGEDLVITGDGKSTRCFQYVDDCVAGLTSLMESSWQHGPVNIGCEKETTIQELADLVVKTVSEITGGPQVGVVYGDPLPDDPLQRRPDCTLAKKVLGWNVKTDLVDGLRRTIDWHIAVSQN